MRPRGQCVCAWRACGVCAWCVRLSRMPAACPPVCGVRRVCVVCACVVCAPVPGARRPRAVCLGCPRDACPRCAPARACRQRRPAFGGRQPRTPARPSVCVWCARARAARVCGVCVCGVRARPRCPSTLRWPWAAAGPGWPSASGARPPATLECLPASSACLSRVRAGRQSWLSAGPLVCGARCVRVACVVCCFNFSNL